jgi:hypothetical protein
MTNWLEFSDDIILSSAANSLNYWKAPKIIDYFQNDQVVCQLKVRKQEKPFRELFSPLDYIGEILYSDHLNTSHLLVIFQFLVIDHIYQLDSNS